MTSVLSVASVHTAGGAGDSKLLTAAGLDFVIDKTWDHEPVDHEPFKIHLEWLFQRVRGKPHKRVVKVSIEGPFFDDAPPPEDLGGFCADLYNYECFEIFFSNDKEQYLEVEVGPHGHWLVLLFNGQRSSFNDGRELELNVKNTLANGGETWKCELEIPLAYFPPKVTRFNAYAMHGQQSDAAGRRHEALFPVTDGSGAFDAPDFHRLQFFGRLDTNRVIPESFNERPFDDMLYGNLWSSVCS